MKNEPAIDRVKGQLYSILGSMRADLDGIEILTAALSAFARPVPEYEPRFRHLRDHALEAQLIR